MLFSLSACGTLSPYDLNPTRTQSNRHVNQFTVGSPSSKEANLWISLNGRFRKALLETSDDPRNSIKASAYLESGMAAADLFCRSYFQKLGEQRADNIAARGVSNVADAATSAALGLASASASTVAGVSVGFSAVESLFETIESAYLVSPEVHQVQALVFEARDVLYQEIFIDSKPSSYPDAERRLSAYHELCTFNGIKRLVGEAVTNGEPTVDNTETESNGDGKSSFSGNASTKDSTKIMSLTVRVR